MHVNIHLLLIQLAVFCAVWFLLSRIFFRPFSMIYEKRSSKTTKAIEEARLLNKESEDMEGELRTKINEAVRTADNLRKSGVEEAKKRREDMLRQANEAMQGQLKSMVERIEKEKAEIFDRLNAEISQFIPMISKKMMLQ
ncbi:MAG: ATP synthase F0 subunit B [Deltaproteobacteria bacterium]|nr:ATP synthase F0 subunit B [Deltaproteobacteria bacterium]MCL5276552.1 ATP synthase F0 subunit B [Deltaproteobacteria bacterium]